MWVPSNTPAALPFTSAYVAVIPIKKRQWMCWKAPEWLKLLLQIHPVPLGRLIWGKYLKSWKSLLILLNAHIHSDLIAVPLAPCKSLRNAVEVWDLLQRDLERLWTEKWRICLSFRNLMVLVYFYTEIFSQTCLNKNMQLERILHQPTSPLSLYSVFISFRQEIWIVSRLEVCSWALCSLLFVIGHIACLCFLTV